MASGGIVAAVLVVVLLVAVGCGGWSQPTPRGAGEVDPVPWNQADVCRLLSEREIGDFLGGSAPEPRPSNLAGRPACEWRVTGSKRLVRLTIYQLPQQGPDLFEARGVPVLDVGGRPAYVTSSSRWRCTLQIAGGPAFITFELKTQHPRKDKDVVCDTVADAGQGVLLRLGW